MDSLKDASLLERKEMPAEVLAACRWLEKEPRSVCVHEKIDDRLLRGYKVYDDRVVIIIGTGQKYTVPLAELMPIPTTTQARPALGKATTKKTPAKLRRTRKG